MCVNSWGDDCLSLDVGTEGSHGKYESGGAQGEAAADVISRLCHTRGGRANKFRDTCFVFYFVPLPKIKF